MAAKTLEELKETIPDDVFELRPAQETPTVHATALHAVAPNPFNPSTEIRYDLKDAGPTKLQIFDVRGRLVTTLVDEHEPSGRHRRVWLGTDAHGAAVASGVYFLILEAEGQEYRRKMALVR